MIARREDKEVSVYKFAVEFAFPSSSNCRSRPAFLYDRRISNLREISGAMLFQQFRSFSVLDFNGGAGRTRKFFYLSLTLHRLSSFFLWAEFCAELSPFVFGSRRHRRKWCVSVPSKACHFRMKNSTRFHKSFLPPWKKKHIFLFMMISKKSYNMKKKYNIRKIYRYYFKKLFQKNHCKLLNII